MYLFYLFVFVSVFLRAPGDDAATGGPADPAAEDEAAARLRSLRMFVAPRGANPAGTTDLGGMISLLQSSDGLRRELGFTERQAGQLKALSTEARRRQEELFRRAREGGGFGPDQGREGAIPIREGPDGFDPGSIGDGLLAIGREFEVGMGKILTAKQRRRLYQIALRIEGPTAIARPDVADAIGLFPAQRVEIAAIVDRLRKMQGELAISEMERGEGASRPEDLPKGTRLSAHDGLNEDRPRRTAGGGMPEAAASEAGPRARDVGWKQDRLLDEADRQIAKVLGPQQKKAFNKLLGPDLDPTILIRPPGNVEGESTSGRSKDPGSRSDHN